MSTSAPSQFAALLRQSRFASYDPSIGQVYASFGGHAHRGNWGLKRPLPLRRRKGNVTVQAIDSTAQQTEWKSGEQQSRWIQMWEEVGLTPKLEDGPWRERLGPTEHIQWVIDSEFGLATRSPEQAKATMVPQLSERNGATRQEKDEDEEEDENASEAIPNIHAMTDREFERYLEKLREMRPAFLRYLNEEAAKAAKRRGATARRVDSLWQQRQAMDNDKYKGFLMSQAYKEYSSHDSRIIEQQPQRYGGLVYARTSMLQSMILTEPQPGRVLERVSGGSQRGHDGGDYVASFAGMTPHLDKRLAENRNPVNWRSLGALPDAPDAMRGPTTFRIAQADLIATPATVSRKPSSLDRVGLETDVYVPPDIEHGKQNPYPPGSREYVGYQDVETRSMVQSSKPRHEKLPSGDWAGPKERDVATLVNMFGRILDMPGTPPSS